MLKLNYMFFTAITLVFAGTLNAYQQANNPVPVNPVTSVGVTLLEKDYLVIKKAVNSANKSEQDGLFRFQLDTEQARLLTVTLFNSQQGTMTKSERLEFLKKQEKYFNDHGFDTSRLPKP